MILEDEEALREIVGEFLRGAGYSVLEARDGAQAMEIVQKHEGPIPLIVSDVVLPGMNGPAAVAKLQELRPEMKALFVTGYAETPVVQALIAEGCTLLQKPISKVELLVKIDEMLHTR